MAFGLLGVVALVATVVPLTAYAWLAPRCETLGAHLAVVGLSAVGLVAAHPAYASASYFFVIGARPEARAYYGLPRAVPWQLAARRGTRVFAAAPLPVHLDAVHLHYDCGRLVRQHLSRLGVPTESRDLRFDVTEQDLAFSVPDDRAATHR